MILVVREPTSRATNIYRTFSPHGLLLTYRPGTPLDSNGYMIISLNNGESTTRILSQYQNPPSASKEPRLEKEKLTENPLPMSMV